MTELLVSILVSPTLALLVSYLFNRDRVCNLLRVQKASLTFVQSLGEDDAFAYDQTEYGNFMTLVYEILMQYGDVMTPTEYVKIQQSLIGSVRRLQLTSRHSIGSTKLLPLLYAMADVKIKAHFSVSVSAVLSACFALTNQLDILEMEEK